MHGLQLWVALPDDARHGPPRFEHHADAAGAARRRGHDDRRRRRAGRRPGRRRAVHTPLVGAEIVLARRRRGPAAARPRLRVRGAGHVGRRRGGRHRRSSRARCSTWDAGATELTLRSAGEARLFLLGGEPFDEPLVMWWNFVARSARGDRGGPRRLGGRAAVRHGRRLRGRPAAGAGDAHGPPQGPGPLRKHERAVGAALRVEPFTVHIGDDVLADLRARIRNTRWPDQVPGHRLGAGHGAGIPAGVAGVLGGRVRLAGAGARAERVPPLPRRPRRRPRSTSSTSGPGTAPACR